MPRTKLSMLHFQMSSCLATIHSWNPCGENSKKIDIILDFRYTSKIYSNYSTISKRVLWIGMNTAGSHTHQNQMVLSIFNRIEQCICGIKINAKLKYMYMICRWKRVRSIFKRWLLLSGVEYAFKWCWMTFLVVVNPLLLTIDYVNNNKL